LCRLLYHRKFEPPENIVHAVDRNIFLISEGFQTGSPGNSPPPPLPELEKYSAPVQNALKKMGISSNDICIGIIPGARWESKSWPPDFFARIINSEALKNKGAKFLIFGSKAETQAANAILEKTDGKNVFSMAGKTSIGELVEFIRRCSCVVTNDSGPMHIAAALRVPTFALFGPTFPEKTGPYGKEHLVFQANIGCIKCFKKYCQDNGYKCHESIDPENVAKKILEYLNNDQ
jgi:lipopolysaccharide heptosyltransferase II